MKHPALRDFDYSQLDKLGDHEHKRVLSVIHPSDQFIRLQTEQLMSQMGLAERKDNNPYDYNDFMTVAKHSCIRANKAYNSSESKMTIFTRAMMTSDFPALLVSVTNKLLSQGWTNATTTYQDWTGTATVKDFKTASLISMSSFSKLNKIQEGEEITNGGMSSESESFKLETFAKMFSVARRSYINDELEVLKGAPLLMGSAARQTVEETVWAVLLSNPTLADGIALVHADHGNLIDGALNTANLDLARAALGKQTSNGIVLNLPPTHLIVPKALEGTARTIANAQYPDGSLKVVASAHLDLVSPTAWYLISNINPPILVATLANHTEPSVTVKSNLITDNLDFRVVYDFCVCAAEYRSIVKSTG